MQLIILNILSININFSLLREIANHFPYFERSATSKIKFSPLGNKNSTTFKRSMTDFFSHFQVVPMNWVWSRTWKNNSTTTTNIVLCSSLESTHLIKVLILQRPYLSLWFEQPFFSVIRVWQNDRVRYTDVFASSNPGIVATWYPEWSTEQQMMQQQGLRCWDLTGFKKIQKIQNQTIIYAFWKLDTVFIISAFQKSLEAVF